MTLRWFVVWMLLATIICWIAFGIVITRFNPFEAGVLSFIFFYTSLFLSVTGTLTILGIYVRIFFIKNSDFIARKVFTSFRQAIMLAAVLVLTLFLCSKNLLTWWNIMLFSVALGLFEFLFISLRKLK